MPHAPFRRPPPSARVLAGAAALLLTAGLAACGDPLAPPTEAAEGAATSARFVPRTVPAGEVRHLRQGFRHVRDDFYTTPEGMPIVPLAWFLSLERPGSEEGFVADGLARFGYLPSVAGARNNPDALPVGFVRDRGPFGDSGTPHVAVTCAACHTRRITVEGTAYQIDGAGGGGDYNAFTGELARALEANGADDKFKRFALRVNPNGATDEAKDTLRRKLRERAAGFAAFVAQSDPTMRDPGAFTCAAEAGPAWGPGRLAALDMIYNRVTGVGLGIKENICPPTAPISIPHLWGTPFHTRVQTNGSAVNGPRPRSLRPLHALARNTGQALGTGAGVMVKAKPQLVSTIEFRKLVLLEKWVKDLRAPKWPKTLPAPDAGLVRAGETIFRGDCASCHTPGARPDSIVETGLHRVAGPGGLGTDGRFLDNFNRRVQTGELGGYTPPLGPLGAGLAVAEPTDTAFAVLAQATFGTILGAPLLEQVAPEDLETVTPADPRTVAMPAPETAVALARVLEPTPARDQENEADPFTGYKARPLDGIWATGPYLHNGSVRTLKELLLPPEERARSFCQDGNAFDPADVGFRDTPKQDCANVLDTATYGNRNTGHAYGTTLDADDKAALLAYLKTL